MSIKCPSCGDNASLALYDTQYFEDGWNLEVVHIYECENCGKKSSGTSYFTCNEEEYMEEMED